MQNASSPVVYSELNLKQLNNTLRALEVRLRNKKQELAIMKGESSIFGAPASVSDLEFAVDLVARIKESAANIDNVQHEIDRILRERVTGTELEEILAICSKFKVTDNEIAGKPTHR